MTIENTNYFLPTHAVMKISKFEELEFSVTGFSIPSINLNPIVQPSPLLEIQQPSNMGTFNSFSVTYNVGEKFQNYMALYRWVRTLACPTSRDEYIGYGSKEVAEITIHIYDANYNEVGKVSLKNAFPIVVPEVPITFENTSADPISVGAEFAYDWFDFNIF